MKIKCKVCNDKPERCECTKCGERDCPYHEPFHYHHDGCPACVSHKRDNEIIMNWILKNPFFWKKVEEMRRK